MSGIQNLIIEIKLSVAYVGFGGNTGEYKYFFAFSNPNIIVTKPNTVIKILLSESMQENFSIKNYVSTDIIKDITTTTKSGKSIVLNDSNTQSQLIDFSIIVYDKKRDYYFSCDPQVLNSPDTD